MNPIENLLGLVDFYVNLTPKNLSRLSKGRLPKDWKEGFCEVLNPHNFQKTAVDC